MITPPTPAGLNCFFDVSHHQKTVDLSAAKAAGMLVVGLKATEGATFTDPTFAERRKIAHDVGLYVVIYHFGDSSPVIIDEAGEDKRNQVDHFLDIVGDLQTHEKLCLDFEENTDPSKTMSIFQAELFCTVVDLDLLYTATWMLGNSTTLRAYDRWLPKYGPQPKEQYRFWQFTDGKQGPFAPCPVPGIGPCDRSVWGGTLEELKQYFGDGT